MNELVYTLCTWGEETNNQARASEGHSELFIRCQLTPGRTYEGRRSRLLALPSLSQAVSRSTELGSTNPTGPNRDARLREHAAFNVLRARRSRAAPGLGRGEPSSSRQDKAPSFTSGACFTKRLKCSVEGRLKQKQIGRRSYSQKRSCSGFSPAW